MRVRHPRTPRLPWAPGVVFDDVWVAGLSVPVGREVVVTEKLGGENIAVYADGLHAPSLDGGEA